MSTEVVKAFPALLEAFKTEVARALPKHVSSDRMARMALTCFRQNPVLGNCDPRSVFACVIQASQLGLELGVQGQAYLVPYRKRDGTYECTFIPGWRGLLDLVSRTGRATAWTGAVYEGDKFEYAYGTNPFITHVTAEDDTKERKLTHVYAIGEINGSSRQQIEVWTAEKCRKHRDKYNKVGDRHYSFQHFEMYARKVVLLQVLKYLPSSAELSRASDFAYAADRGPQGLTIEGAVTGTWTIPAEEPDIPEATPEAGRQTAFDKLKQEVQK